MNTTIITIGDELLIGQVTDTNSAWMGQQLSKAGISVVRKITVGDEKEEIIAALNEAKSISDLILITGGLGPTKDDITKHTLCEYFGSKLVFNEEIFIMVKSLFEQLNRPWIESNRTQAEVPDNCIPIKNHGGTAPGMWFEKEGKVFISMPGVPYEMKAMMQYDVIPKLKEQFQLPVIIHKTIHTQGIGESALAEKISDIEDSFPEGFKLAYLPNLSLLRLRISAKGTDEAALQKKVDELAQKLRERIGDYVWGEDDVVLEEVVGKILREQHATLSTAESCTGGLIAHMITSIPGASDYFLGSVISYSDELKKNLLGVKEETLSYYGAVSEETIREMVAGALERMNSTYAIAVSGIAGPSGGTTKKPIGTVWIAVGKKEVIVVKKFLFPGKRDRIIETASVNALSMLRRFMLGMLTP